MIRSGVGSYNRADRKHLPDDTEQNKQEIYIWKHLQEKLYQYNIAYGYIGRIDDMKQYGFSPLRPELAGQIQKGDIIVAGKNFGCGSSREQAPEIIKALGVQCVIAKSFARIFFRNSINNGLLLIEQPDLHDNVKEGDQVTVVMNEHVEHNGKQYPIASLPENLMDIIQAGGLLKAMRKLNGLD